MKKTQCFHMVEQQTMGVKRHELYVVLRKNYVLSRLEFQTLRFCEERQQVAKKNT